MIQVSKKEKDNYTINPIRFTHTHIRRWKWSYANGKIEHWNKTGTKLVDNLDLVGDYYRRKGKERQKVSMKEKGE